MKKRLLTALIAAIFVLSGCGQGGTSSSQAALSNAQEKVETSSGHNSSDVPLETTVEQPETNDFHFEMPISMLAYLDWRDKPGHFPESTGSYETDIFEFSTRENNTVVIDRYIGPAADKIEVPDSLNGLPVVYIGNNSFENVSVKEVIIPEGVKAILSGAFKNSSISSITIPDSLVEIADYAFENCQNLHTVNGNFNSLVHIGTCALSDTPYFKSITHSDEFVMMGHVLVRWNRNKIIDKQAGKEIAPTTVTIPDGVVSICGVGAHVISGEAITEVILPQSLLYAGPAAFDTLPNLETMKFPDGLLFIGSAPVHLLNFEIPDSVIAIGDHAFQRPPILHEDELRQQPPCEIKLSENLRYIGLCAFHSNIFESVTIPASVEMIGELAFNGQTSRLSEVTILNPNTKIADNAFKETPWGEANGYS